MTPSPGSRLLDLLERSVLVQAVATLAVVGTDCALWLTNRAVPSELLQLTWALLGIFIGAKIANASARASSIAKRA